MSEVTKEDMNRVYDKLEEVVSTVSETNTNVAVMDNKLDTHLKSHARWSGPITRMMFDIVKMGVVFTAAWIFAKR